MLIICTEEQSDILYDIYANYPEGEDLPEAYGWLSKYMFGPDILAGLAMEIPEGFAFPTLADVLSAERVERKAYNNHLDPKDDFGFWRTGVKVSPF